jgi:hypothetical protein
MIHISDRTVNVAGTHLLPVAFPGLVERHPQGVAKALALEKEAHRLMAGDFSDRQLREFMRSVCEWGGYPKTADKVLAGNPFSEIRRRFSNAMAALASKKPDYKFALREIRSLRFLGLSFASKHLRLLRPDVCPVLDSILSEQLAYPLNVAGYRRFSDDCLRLARWLNGCGVLNPIRRKDDKWFAADVEMALYVHVKEQLVSRRHDQLTSPPGTDPL